MSISDYMNPTTIEQRVTALNDDQAQGHGIDPVKLAQAVVDGDFLATMVEDTRRALDGYNALLHLIAGTINAVDEDTRSIVFDLARIRAHEIYTNYQPTDQEK